MSAVRVTKPLSLAPPAAVRRVEQAGETVLREPDDCLQLQRVQIAHAAAAQILQAQPRRVSVNVESDRHLGEFIADDGADTCNVEVLVATEFDRHHIPQITKPSVGRG